METKQVTLSEFLLARIAEDEENWRDWLREESPGPWAQLLAECEAKRHLVELFVSADTHAKRHLDVPMLALTAGAYESALRVLSRPYADHPDFRPEWRP